MSIRKPVISSTTSDRTLYCHVVVNLQSAAACGISFWRHRFGHSADGQRPCHSFTQTIGGPALVDCPKRFLDGKALLQGFLRIIDLAATGAREIALEKRFQHQYQRKTLFSRKLPLYQVLCDPVLLDHWNGRGLSRIAALAAKHPLHVRAVRRYGCAPGPLVPSIPS